MATLPERPSAPCTHRSAPPAMSYLRLIQRGQGLYRGDDRRGHPGLAAADRRWAINWHPLATGHDR